MELATEAPVPLSPAVTNAMDAAQASGPWPVWQRVLFRFFFVYLMLQMAPWNWCG